MISHNVYFTLEDSSSAAVDRLLAACRKYLVEHPGVVRFACGRIEPDLDREVNDREFHVALHVDFEDRASHDAYQVAADHERFIEENRDNWVKVRVFDSVVE